jgi:hypothetical protein
MRCASYPRVVPQLTELSAGKRRHSLDGAVVIAVAHQRSDEACDSWIGAEQLTVFVRLQSAQHLRLWFRRVADYEQLVATADMTGRRVAVMAEAGQDSSAVYRFVDSGGKVLLCFQSSDWSWHPFDDKAVFAFMLNEKQQAAVRAMMDAVVRRDRDAVAQMLAADLAQTSASPGDFWMWADDYGDRGRLSLIMPPGDVADWDVWGFHWNRGDPEGLYLHAEVWADFGRTDLTIRFDLVPDGDGCRIELEDMHVM